MSPDGLLAHKLNLGDMKPERTRPGWYIGPSGEVMIQPMVHSETHANESKREERGPLEEGYASVVGMSFM
ncbi:hypothetical protein V1508DRAFT_396270 [Lipomyces doorenjongii]|uniref:uncharacterized protein n=1 Tax=Lipomyces doorenjongii TaxID=383834 RepID=UPI0034CF7F1A